MNIDTLLPKDKAILVAAEAIRQREAAKETRRVYAEQSKLRGKCFRYRNSYGPSDQGWWLYMRVDSVEKDGGFRGLSFQTDSSGTITIMPDKWHMSLLDGYSEITVAQFNKAFGAMQQKAKKSFTK